MFPYLKIQSENFIMVKEQETCTRNWKLENLQILDNGKCRMECLEMHVALISFNLYSTVYNEQWKVGKQEYRTASLEINV